MAAPESFTLRTLIHETWRRQRAFAGWIICCLATLYVLSGVYSVSPSQLGVHLRFGRVLDDKVLPGIHYALPWPVDRVMKVPVHTVRRMLIDDFYSASPGAERTPAAEFFQQMTGLDTYCITGDNNLLNIMCTIQYTIVNPCYYLFNIEDLDVLLRSITGNAIIHCLAAMPIDDALTRRKPAIAQFIKAEIQRRLDEARSGLNVSSIELSDIKPPDRVQQYFSDVVNATIDRVKMINDAKSYCNEKIPAANADANRMLQEAEAYEAEVVLHAAGEADRFEKLLDQVHGKGDSPRELLYIESLKEIMSKVEKIHIIERDKKGDAAARLKLSLTSP